jgi:hypothetical protein
VYPIPFGEGLFESVLEWIDPESGELLASERVEQEFVGFVNRQSLFSYRTDEFGRPTVEIWQVRVGR